MVKTIWHWREIFKTLIIILSVGVFISLMQLPDSIVFFVGFIAGFVAMIFCMSKWDLYHFE